MHLTEDQIVAVLCAAASDADVQHARQCAECGGAGENFRNQLEEARAEHLQTAERDDSFWLRQQAAIRHKIRPQWSTQTSNFGCSGAPAVVPRWVVGVAALVVLAVGLILAGPPEPTRAQSPQSDPDYQLLVEVEQNLARPVPMAIQPATVLSADLNAAWQSAMAQHSQRNAAQR